MYSRLFYMHGISNFPVTADGLNCDLHMTPFLVEITAFAAAAGQLGIGLLHDGTVANIALRNVSTV